MSGGQDDTIAQELARSIAFGAEVERFLQSPIGKFLVEHAERQIESAMETFRTVNPTDHAAITAIQVQLKVADSVQDWLASAVSAGYEAERMLEQASFTD